MFKILSNPSDGIELHIIEMRAMPLVASPAKLRNFSRALSPLFPSLNNDLSELKILSTFQKTASIAGQRSQESELLKDQCLDKFMEFAQKLHSKLSESTAEVLYDYVDPASGTLMLNTSAHVFSEVEVVETFLIKQAFTVT